MYSSSTKYHKVAPNVVKYLEVKMEPRWLRWVKTMLTRCRVKVYIELAFDFDSVFLKSLLVRLVIWAWWIICPWFPMVTPIFIQTQAQPEATLARFKIYPNFSCSILRKSPNIYPSPKSQISSILPVVNRGPNLLRKGQICLLQYPLPLLSTYHICYIKRI